MNYKTITSRLALPAALLISLALPANASESVLYSFDSSANGGPYGRLLLQKNALFGTTDEDGDVYGTVFELKKSGSTWKKKTLFAFDGTNGAYPFAGLIADASGVLYGTSSSAGPYNGGTAFMLSNADGVWSEQTIWNFGNTGDGDAPTCDLIMDSTGTLYGTTQSGGVYNLGTVFKLSNSGGVWTDTVLYSFAGGNDGQHPAAGLVMDNSGALFGTTIQGGTNNEGTAFELAQSGGTWTETVLHAFGSGNDGQQPGGGPLVMNAGGDLYGTTQYGGAKDWGIVFVLSLSGRKWKEKVLHTFTDGNDGGTPEGGLLMGDAGVLYGTTSGGGMNNGGTVFALSKSGGAWTESVLSNFPNTSGDGEFPRAAVIEEKKTGTLYGTTSSGGADTWGTVYQILQ